MSALKLYRITCKGMRDSHGVSYAVAHDPSEAYQLVREHLDHQEFGFGKDRAMEKIELVAEVGTYTECGISLYIASEQP
jgi:hypothetical protein